MIYKLWREEGTKKSTMNQGVIKMAKRYEDEHEERVEHDTVMVLVNGKMVEVTGETAA